MKKSTLIAIIIGLITFIGAAVATLCYLKKKGILFIDEDEFDYDLEDDFEDGVEILDEVTENVVDNVDDEISEAKDNLEEKVDDLKDRFGF
ncbi:MAG: hypothetical protein GX928_04635 [Ruminococcaceae bacterium]|jgi:flagellar basal body-associated protein FliL|nr:hypothetical protein [Oscillospiraceae bacterium]